MKDKITTFFHNIKNRLASVQPSWLVLILCVLVISIIVAVFAVIHGSQDTFETNDSNLYNTEESVYPPPDPDTSSDTESENHSENDSETESESNTDSITTDEETEDLPDGVASLSVTGNYVPSDSALSTLYDTIDAFGYRVGFIAVDINTGMTIAYDADSAYEPASIIKAAYVYYVCRMIDQGEASLDDKITYTEADVVHGNGTIGKSGIGKEYTIRDIIKYTVTKSDNEGYYMLVRSFGRSGYDKLMKSLGCGSALLSGGRWPDVTARDFSLIWREIYDYRNETATGQWLYDLFLNVNYKHFFKDALGVDTANKAGWNDTSYNESGIVYGDRTYIFVLLADASYYDSSTEAYNKIILAVNSMMTEYSQTADPMPETDRFDEIETEPPVTETEPPATETEPPVTETEPPVTETEPPVTETEPPVTETEPPVTETEPPVTETEPPVTETEPPVTETEPPVTETEPPMTETETPVTETEPPEAETTETPSPVSLAPMSDEHFANMIAEAEKYLGYSYKWGGSKPSTGFDCSGYVSYVINNCGNGWSIGRKSSKALYNICTTIDKDEAAPGDLIFFRGTYNTKGVSHVGIYVGNGMMIHCGDPISYVTVTSGYWKDHFYTYGRFNT